MEHLGNYLTVFLISVTNIVILSLRAHTSFKLEQESQTHIISIYESV